MAVRDRLVAVVLAAGLLLGMAGWQSLSPWLGIAVAIAAVIAACAIYRIEPDGLHREHILDEREDDEADQAVSRPRRAAGRP